METRMSGGDVRWSRRPTTAKRATRPIAYLADDSSEPTRVIEARSRDWLAGDGIAKRSTRWTRAAAASSKSAG
jgi:RNA polymerase sigma-32 factor